MKHGKVYLNVGEQDIVRHLMEIYQIGQIEAMENVINQKRELAYIHRERGRTLLDEDEARISTELAKQITSELGEEWID